jgi:hypothetical protein
MDALPVTPSNEIELPPPRITVLHVAKSGVGGIPEHPPPASVTVNWNAFSQKDVSKLVNFTVNA